MLNKEQVLNESKDFIRNNYFLSLDEAIKKTPNAVTFLASLLFCCGFFYVKVKKEDQNITFFAGNLKDDLDEKLVFNKNTHTIRGKFYESLKKVFLLVTAIEHELSLPLPYEMRRNKIIEICNRINVDMYCYERILQNW